MTDSVALESAEIGKFPKREKKKAETRQKIIDASLDLYFESDPGDITLNQVAERAGIHVQTLYRHFPNKMSLMVAGDEYWLEKFESFLKDNQDTGNTFTVWKNWQQYAFAEFLEDADKFRHLYERKAASHTGFATLSANQLRYEDLLCDALANDFGMSAKGTGLPRLVAGMLVAGNAAVVREFVAGATDLIADSIGVIETVEELFDHLMD